MPALIDLGADSVVSLPVDQLAMIVLADIANRPEWNQYNYTLGAHRDLKREDAGHAVAEAMAWLSARCLIARPPSQSDSNAIFVTRLGQQILREGLHVLRAHERLQEGMHRLVEAVARPQFLIGQYELGVFAAMRRLEIRVRDLSELGPKLFGVDLMRKAFGPGGPLVDETAPRGEQEGTMFLFTGAYAVLRNSSGHREVDYSDVTEAAEAIQTASLLMRILDRIEDRIQNEGSDRKHTR